MPSNNFPGIGYTNHGYDYNFFQKFTVTATTTFGSDTVDGYQPSVIINLAVPTYTVIMTNLTAAGSSGNTWVPGAVVEYSFNGNTVHGELGSCFENISLTFQNRVISTIWFRVQTGSSGSPVVTVQAWSHP
jgi:hypothetical protein